MLVRNSLDVDHAQLKLLQSKSRAVMPASHACKLCRWGLDKAREEGLAVTLFASGMGKVLYEKLGFKQVGVAHVQVDGEEEEINIPAMVAGTNNVKLVGDDQLSIRALVH